MTPELSRALQDLKAKLPNEYAQITHIGVTNCRRKNNRDTAPWSEHAWSNAGDLHVNKTSGDKLAAYMRSRPDLWSEVYWQITFHYDHIHGTAAPRRNYDNQQIPPCAGGEEGLEDMTPAEREALITDIVNRIMTTPLGTSDGVSVKWGLTRIHNYAIINNKLLSGLEVDLTDADIDELAAALLEVLPTETAKAIGRKLAE